MLHKLTKFHYQDYNLFSKMCHVSYLGMWWRHDIWIPGKLKFEYLMNEKSFRSEIKNIFLVS